MKIESLKYFSPSHLRTIQITILGNKDSDKTSRAKFLRDEFAKLETEYEYKLKAASLNEEDLLIDQRHKEAVEKGHFTYDDPLTGYRVMTRLRHFLRGSCCGNACRHCIYNHENVLADLKKKRMFNGAFWVDKQIEFDNMENVHSQDIEKTKEDTSIEDNDPLLFKH